MLAWGLSVALFVHVTSFMGVSYFGQIIMLWFMTLGMISGIEPQPEAQRLPSIVRRRVVASAIVPLRGQPVGAT